MYRNFLNKAMSGNRLKKFSFSGKLISSCQSLASIYRKNNALQSQNHTQKVKNDSCSTYANVLYIVSIGQLVILIFHSWIVAIRKFLYQIWNQRQILQNTKTKNKEFRLFKNKLKKNRKRSKSWLKFFTFCRLQLAAWK